MGISLERELSEKDEERLIRDQAIDTVATRAMSLKGFGEDANNVPHDIKMECLPRYKDEGIPEYNKRAVEICKQNKLTPRGIVQVFMENHVEELGDFSRRRQFVKALERGVKQVYIEAGQKLSVKKSAWEIRN